MDILACFTCLFNFYSIIMILLFGILIILSIIFYSKFLIYVEEGSLALRENLSIRMALGFMYFVGAALAITGVYLLYSVDIMIIQIIELASLNSLGALFILWILFQIFDRGKHNNMLIDWGLIALTIHLLTLTT